MDASKILVVLDGVRTLLTPPEHWMQGDYARTARGASCSPKYSGATAWCLLGALEKQIPSRRPVLRYAEWMLAVNVTRELIRIKAKTRDIPSWNDYPRRTHADVLALLDAVAADVQYKREHGEFVPTMQELVAA